MTLAQLFRRPSAVLPVAMSFAALAIELVDIAVAGVKPQADEGTAAHAWQLLMAGQLPAMIHFALRWLPRAPTRPEPWWPCRLPR